MNFLFFIVAAFLCAQSVRCDDLPNPALVYGQIVDAVVAGLNGAQTDVSPIVSGVKTTTTSAANSVNAFIQDTQTTVEGPATKQINDIVAELKSAVNPSCAIDYTAKIAFFQSYFGGNVKVCGVNRFTLLLQQNVLNLKDYVVAGATAIKDRLTTAQDNGQDFIPKLIAAGTDSLVQTVQSSVTIGWTQEALAYEACIAANSAYAVTSRGIFLEKFVLCQPF